MQNDGNQFEQKVIAVARYLWPNSQINGSYTFNGRERDGVFITEDVIHLLEVTTSKTKDKAYYDVLKLTELKKEFVNKYPEKHVKCWFITKCEPTADQRAAIEPTGVAVVSFEQFQNRLFNATDYLNKRDLHSFGSVRDPKTDKIKFEDKYVPTNLVEASSNLNISISTLSSKLTLGSNIYVILGHFGVGKSLTCKEIFNQLKTTYRKNRTNKFPIFLNLREHDGQKNPAEALIRHATHIGFDNPNSLVYAWKLGFVTLILDGLDEMPPLTWIDRPTKSKQVRYGTMTLLRHFIEESPSDVSILMSGRINYFDSDEECVNSLGGNGINILHLHDFDEHQLTQYLKENSLQNIKLPEWFPTRPLLISYLVNKNFLKEKILTEELDPASGWDWLLDKICEREAKIENGIDPKTIRDIIEKLASFCRTLKISSLGPIPKSTIHDIFTEIVGYNPESEKRALIMLQRLPGLSAPTNGNDEFRYFIDENLLQAACAGEVFKYILSPYLKDRVDNPHQWVSALSPLGISTIALHVNKKKIDSNTVMDAIRLSKQYDSDALTCDLLLSLNEIETPWIRGRITVSDVVIPTLELKTGLLSSVEFREVIVKNLIVDIASINEDIPLFEKSLILSVQGVHIESMLPSGRFNSVDFEKFDDYIETNEAILSREDLNIVQKISITILRKLYLQKGGGRQEKSLRRGLSPKHLVYVDQVLDIIEKENLAFKSKGNGINRVWIPIRSKTKEVMDIVKLRDKNNNFLSMLKNY